MKLFRQVFEVEVLSEGAPLPNDVSLSRIEYEITDGCCSGMIEEMICEEVSPERMRELLIEQGSDPDFLETGV